jgi:hypothetical protein
MRCRNEVSSGTPRFWMVSDVILCISGSERISSSGYAICNEELWGIPQRSASELHHSCIRLLVVILGFSNGSRACLNSGPPMYRRLINASSSYLQAVYKYASLSFPSPLFHQHNISLLQNNQQTQTPSTMQITIYIAALFAAVAMSKKDKCDSISPMYCSTSPSVFSPFRPIFSSPCH